MSAVWTAAALLGALLLQSGLGRAWPGAALLIDAFLLVVVYVGLTRGETAGMLTGMAAGWIQDVQFGGTVVGFAALSKLIVGFAVGFAASRFMLVAALPRLALVVCASLLDGLLFERLAALLGVPVDELSLTTLAGRALLSALVGVPVYQALDRRLRRGLPA
jgi:rod shape-determining protein MreD